MKSYLVIKRINGKVVYAEVGSGSVHLQQNTPKAISEKPIFTRPGFPASLRV